MDVICPRCNSPLACDGDSAPAFCHVCGLPQLRVSADAIASSEPASVVASAVPQVHAHSRQDWRAALNIVFLASLAGALPPMLVPGAVENGIVGGMVLLISPVLTIGAILVYHRRRGRRVVNSAMGARMGALLGLMMGFWIAAGTGIKGFVLRYHYGSRVLEQKVAEAMSAVPGQLQSAGQLPPDALARLQQPEFRATAFLLGYLFTTTLLLLCCTLFGSAAAAMLRARRSGPAA